MRSIVVMSVLALIVVPACGKKVGASKDFEQAMLDVRTDLRELTQALPVEDSGVERDRARDPGAAARRIETAIVPRLDRALASMDRAESTGHAYLDVADGEAPDALAGIRRNLDALARRRTAFASVRDLYEEEAGLLHEGPLAPADADRLARRMVDLMTAAAQ